MLVQAALAAKTQPVEEMFANQSFLQAGGRKTGAYLAARQADIEADRNSAILLHTVQDEAQQAMKYLNTLPPTERSQLVRKMCLQWHPGVLQSLASAKFLSCYACC